MDERRNHYRVLHLQPDAPFEVVRANHRALMVKLRAHPDLGGESLDAAYLNVAYATLRDPKLRAAYDRELLERYDIRTLAHASFAAAPSGAPARSGVNQRNYYRVLEVQPESPIEIIESSYAALRKAGAVPRALLDAARLILTLPARRRAYDRELAKGGHLAAIAALEVAEQSKREPPQAPPEPKPEVGAEPAAPPEDYDPLITHYCAFCKTPHGGSTPRNADATCIECASPLFPPPAELLELSRRAVARVPRNDPLSLFAYWPARAQPGRLLDLSPTGLRVNTAADLERGDVIKIDSPAFAAVGAVAHAAPAAGGSVGIRFLAVRFEQPRGTFVSRRA